MPKKLVQLGRPGHGPESWWLTRAPYCIRPDALSVDPSFITSYTEYAQDMRGVGVWLSPGGSWHRCPGALTSGGSDAEQQHHVRRSGFGHECVQRARLEGGEPVGPPLGEKMPMRVVGVRTPRLVLSLSTTESVDLSCLARAPDRTRWEFRWPAPRQREALT